MLILAFAVKELITAILLFLFCYLRIILLLYMVIGEESNKEELVRSLSSDKYYRCSITIVCLRGLTAAVELSSIHGVESGSCVIREVFNIHDNYKSLIHILYLIFSRILPSTVVDYSKCVKNLVLPEGVLSLVLHSLQLLKCVISVDPGMKLLLLQIMNNKDIFCF